MTKSNKSTKRALLLSVLSMVLCVAMLAGSTFAWFTDSADSATNRIEAGNLDVDLLYKNASTGGRWLDATKADAKFFVDKDGYEMDWEPGVMSVTQFKVVNKGTVALKYGLASIAEKFNWTFYTDEAGRSESHNLTEVIKFAQISNDTDYTSRDAVLAANPTFGKFGEIQKANGELLPDAEEIFTVAAYWKPDTTGNTDNYFNLKNGQKTYVEGVGHEDSNLDTENPMLYIEIGVKLTATQMPYENDSFDNQYDAVTEPTTIHAEITDDFEGEFEIPIG